MPHVVVRVDWRTYKLVALEIFGTLEDAGVKGGSVNIVDCPPPQSLFNFVQLNLTSM